MGLGDAAEDADIESKRQAALLQLPGVSNKSDFDADQRLIQGINAESASENAVVQRRRGLRLRGLQDEVDITGLEAKGKGLTAQAESISRGAKLAAAGSGSDAEELAQLEIGENRLRGYQRQLQNSGSFQEIAPGSGGPGFSNSTNTDNTADALTTIANLLDDFGKRIDNLLLN